jgi:hypothetical protein
MKYFFKRIAALMTTVLIFGWVQCLQAETKNMTIEDLKKGYDQAVTAEAKRKVCLDAIDLGFLARGKKVEVVSQIFGKDFNASVNRLSDGSGYGLLDFIPASKGSDSQAAAYEGWYLMVKYDQSQLIQNYYLTNIHK